MCDFIFILYIIHHNHSLNHYSGKKGVNVFVLHKNKKFFREHVKPVLLPSIITPVL